MTDNKTTPRKRRAVSKARMYKELGILVDEYALTESNTIEELFDIIKEAIVDEAIKS